MKNCNQKFIGIFALVFAVSSTVNAQETVDNYLELPEGWSMFGYTCIDSVDAIVGFSSISDKIEIVKDEWGLSYIPSWEFNAMGSLKFSEGYQINMIEEVTDFQFCPTISEGNVDDDSCSYPECPEVNFSFVNTGVNMTLFAPNGVGLSGTVGAFVGDMCIGSSESDGGPIQIAVMGNDTESPELDGALAGDIVTLILQHSYGIYVTETSFEYVLNGIEVIENLSFDFFCTTALVNPEDLVTLADVDAAYAAGAASVIPEDGISQYDLDALMESFEGYTPPLNLQIGDIHAGGIVFQINENGSGLVAAMEDLGGLYGWGQAVTQAPNYSSEGYTGWHLPSLEELELMYNTIGQGSPLGNIGSFEDFWYWTSSEYYALLALNEDFVFGGGPTVGNQYGPALVRVIRAF